MNSNAVNPTKSPSDGVRILGVNFFSGDPEGAIRLLSNGGLLVAPAAPGLVELPYNRCYRDALSGADVVIADSAFMVLIWNALKRASLRRLSGLEYLRELLRIPDLREPAAVFWIMPSLSSSERNIAWLRQQSIPVDPNFVYVAPSYGDAIADPLLLARLGALRPRHVIITIGGGTQEPLGFYLKQNLEYRPAIHCIGAAIAFLSGDQVEIPGWADKLYLGWLLRCISSPMRYLPRYWRARKLLSLIIRYQSEPPAV